MTFTRAVTIVSAALTAALLVAGAAASAHATAGDKKVEVIKAAE
ncbi:hypothetical protein ACFWIA_24415 [Streptomyces sp. NPDC127068]